jgi:hypothetical protein
MALWWTGSVTALHAVRLGRHQEWATMRHMPCLTLRDNTRASGASSSAPTASWALIRGHRHLPLTPHESNLGEAKPTGGPVPVWDGYAAESAWFGDAWTRTSLLRSPSLAPLAQRLLRWDGETTPAGWLGIAVTTVTRCPRRCQARPKSRRRRDGAEDSGQKN